jgi:hypothetical protein
MEMMMFFMAKFRSIICSFNLIPQKVEQTFGTLTERNKNAKMNP